MFIGWYKDGVVYLLVYVDDILLTGPDPKLIKAAKTAIQVAFEARDLGEAKHVWNQQKCMVCAAWGCGGLVLVPCCQDVRQQMAWPYSC
jgi:hypothetical protein